jgi:hypothetical protein
MTSSYSSSVRSSVIPTLQSAASTLHRSPILSPPPYNHPNTATHQGTVVPYAGQNAQVHGGIDHSAGTGGPSYTVHAYCLKEYAYVFVNSHADSPQDTPVIYGGEETTGTVQLPRCRLQEVQSIVVVVRRLLVGVIAIELDIYSSVRSIPIPRNRRIRQRWCCCPGKLILLIT